MPGGGLSTDEFYPDARTTSCGVAAQDRARNSERLTAGATDRIRQVAPVQLSSRPTATFAGRDRPDADCPAHGVRRSAATGTQSLDQSSSRERKRPARFRLSRTIPLSLSRISDRAPCRRCSICPRVRCDLLKSKAVASRRAWQRFVAIRIAHADALPMDPLFFPDALAVIDRHYNSLVPYRAGRPRSVRRPQRSAPDAALCRLRSRPAWCYGL